MPSPVSLAVVVFALVHAVVAMGVTNPWIALAVTALAMPATSFTSPGSVALFKQLYDSCNGPKWFQCNTKLTDPCSCSTITCNINGTIAKLSLSFNNLQAATFPSAIVDAFIEAGATLVDFSGNPQLGIVNSLPACFPVPECLSSPQVACFFDRPVCTSSPTAKGGGKPTPAPKVAATPKPVKSSAPATSPTKKPVKTPIAPTTTAPTASPLHSVFVTSGGFVPEGTPCVLPFTDKASGRTFSSCAPFQNDNKLPWTGGQPYRQPLPPFTNTTWCYTGISMYSTTNDVKRKQWGFCGKHAVTEAPTHRPVVVPTTPQPTTPQPTPLPTKKGASTTTPTTAKPTAKPQGAKSASPTSKPSVNPTPRPTKPTKKGAKSASPTSRPTPQPSPFPTKPTKKGSKTKSPTRQPTTLAPTKPTTKSPTHKPQKKTASPTGEYEYEGLSTAKPTAKKPTGKPTPAKSTNAPSTAKPSKRSTPKPTKRSPTKPTTHAPTPPPVNGTHSPSGEYEYEGESAAPTHRPTPLATQTPTKKGQTRAPTQQPTSAQPSRVPTKTKSPAVPATGSPHTKAPTGQPTPPTAFSVYFTSGGYVPENSLCHFPFKDQGVTYTSCAPFTGAADHPYVGASDLPRVPINASVSNATWCFTGNAATYDGTNTAIRKDWGYCGSILVGTLHAPTASPSARPAALVASGAPSTSAPVTPTLGTEPVTSPNTKAPGAPTNAPASIVPPTPPPSSSASAARWQASYIIVAAAATAMAVCAS